MAPSTVVSSTPVTVTVRGTRASAGVNVSDAGETVPSVRSELLRPMVTSAVGMDVRTTVKVPVPPASVVTRPDVGVTVTPAGDAVQQTGADVVMVRLQPPAMLPPEGEKSSRTKRLHVPFGSILLNSDRAVGYG